MKVVYYVVMILVLSEGVIAWFGKKPANKKCLFEPCKDYCRNGGNCTQDDSTCMPLKCDCPPGFSGGRCEKNMESVTTTVDSRSNINGCQLRPLEERMCFPFQCQHGYCNKTNRNQKCVCDKNWTGDRCTRMDCSPCGSGVSCTNTPSCDGIICESPRTTKEVTRPPTSPSALNLRPLAERLCAPSFECIHGFCRNTGGISCVCDRGYKGLFCSDSVPTTTPTVEEDDPDVCSEDYSLRPLSVRNCFAAFTCKYGVCVTKRGAVGPRYSCVCDPHASGEKCEHKCCRNCGDFGSCVVNNGEQLCNCQMGHSGDFCNITVTEAVSEEQVSDRPSNWGALMVGICAVVLVFLLLTVVLIPYILWRKGFVLIMKIVHFFQPFEQNDGMEYDAIIMYSADSQRDTRIAKDFLYSYLTQHCGFNVKVEGHRQSTDENIKNTIKKSRRLILLLSSDFIYQEWPSLSGQISEENFLKLKKRVVPVLTEESSKSCIGSDVRLKDLISRSVFIIWSDVEEDKARNLKRIKYSLPKKRRDFCKKTDQEKAKVNVEIVKNGNTHLQNGRESYIYTNGQNAISKNEQTSLSSVDFNHNPYNLPYYKE
ncbi:sushi, von Willebrand factor type A, EGF and pentraxin domain-containing protein 1-like [Saccostrea echinata]|uniref:sushi, von Willebrand factor type A, EGF and pentraxin domain-containing protein 1-like n=1 Tax=Saccostrea echinata TaxID=191078 RepID=UPI002A824CFA|nr:sushi, von Willebrand factor type A, EGF and pentraxin domain-containing protein 1-like [Saccostrea echinata]